MRMLHHISFAVTDVKRSAAFYDAVLEPMGYRRVVSYAGWTGWGLEKGEDVFAIKLRKRGVKIPGPGFHLAFAAPSRKAVDAFYRAALKHGGKDNGPAGLQSEYGPHYYAAFVFDPDGYRIEAVINSTYDQDGYRLKAVAK
jgi:catechol 2,3-dioxygenase-like lactoylglutathione lyase family enzyme